MHPAIQLAILVKPGCRPNRHLRRWSDRFDHRRQWPGSSDRQGIPAARNDLLAWFRDESGLPWLLMVDHDVVPLPETQRLLASDAPIAGPRIWAKTGAEAHPHGLSAACLKIHRRVVAALRAPWFRYRPRKGQCECAYFIGKARAAGFRPEKVGLVGHRFPVVVCPGENGPAFKFDSEIDHVH
jgi:hypothetical protein